MSLLSLLSLLCPAARACECAGVPASLPTEILAPRPNAVAVPSNAAIWVAMRGTDPGYLDGFTLTSTILGTSLAASWDLSALYGTSGLAELMPDAPFLEGDEISVALGETPVLTFTTSGTADNAPPIWDGDVERERVHDHKYCGEHAEIDWTLKGVSEHQMPGSLFIHLLPRGPNAERWVAGTEVVLSWDEMCGGNEPSMVDDFHRSYDAEVWDPSGNRSETHRLSTGGCNTGAVAGAPCGWPMVFFVLVSAWGTGRRILPRLRRTSAGS